MRSRACLSVAGLGRQWRAWQARLFRSAGNGYSIRVVIRDESSETATAPAARAGRVSPVLLLLVGFALVVLSVAFESVVALAIVFLEGPLCWLVVACAALAGGWVPHLLGLGRAPWRYRLILGATIGLGLLSLTTLALGAAGLLNRPTAVLLVIILAAAGTLRLVLDWRAWRAQQPKPETALSSYHWFWLAAGPFLALILAANTLPPGALWAEEGGGYDVLEYHLAVPKIFYEQGQITFLPNNVYSNFPLNAEMLFLLMMVLRGDAIEAAFMAQFVNAALAVLWIAAAWLAGREFSPRAGVLAGVLAAVSPWIAYLAGIAYVEPGMLAMGMAALAAMLRAARTAEHTGRWSLLAGLLVGLCCGFKYTAIPLIALPLGLFPPFFRVAWPKRFLALGIFGLGALLTFSPWMVRNLINTHNPLFPLAYSIFGAKTGTWDEALNERWEHAHRDADVERLDKPLSRVAVERTVGDFRLGPWLCLLAIVGAITRRDRWTITLVLILAMSFTIWLLATHLFARFAVALLPPLIVLAARILEETRSKWMTRAVWGIVVVGVCINLYLLGGLYYDHTRVGGEPLDAYGRTDWFVEGQWPGTQHVGAINRLNAGSRVLLVGEARTFYLRTSGEYAVVFNHHPLAEDVRQSLDERAVLERLAARGVTHVLAHWGEMERLRRSYGFDPEIDVHLFQRLSAAGLNEVESFVYPAARNSYATLYEVPRHE